MQGDLGERCFGEEVELKREWEERAWNQGVQRNVTVKGSREIGGLWRGKWVTGYQCGVQAQTRLPQEPCSELRAGSVRTTLSWLPCVSSCEAGA